MSVVSTARPPRDSDADDLRAEPEGDAVLAMQGTIIVSQQWRRDATKRPVRRFDHDDFTPAHGRGGGDLQADETSADHHHALACRKLCAKRTAVLERANIMAMFVGARHIERAHPRAGREEQHAVIDARSVGEGHATRLAVDRRGRNAKL